MTTERRNVQTLEDGASVLRRGGDMSDHPYMAGFMAGATGARYIQAYEAFRPQLTGETFASYEFSSGYADGRLALMACEAER